MDEFEKNEMNGDTAQGGETQSAGDNGSQSSETRNTNAPSGWTYSANTNQYASWDGNSGQSGAQWNQNQQQNRQRREYGTQYGYYSNQGPTPNYYSNNGANPCNNNGYQWDFNRYESAGVNNAPKKKSSGKGFRVFLTLIAVILGCCVIALASFGIYSLVSDEAPLEGSSGSYSSQAGQDSGNNAQNSPQFSLEARPDGEETTVSADGKLSATEIYSTVSPSVVGVVQYQYAASFEPSGSGSGIIISEDGYILTNAHVVKGASAVKVVLYNEEEYEAKIVGSDAQTDIAVLKIEANNLTVAKLGDSAQVKVGETVYAIGNPGGLSLQSSFTDGIISGVDRLVTTSDNTYAMTVLQTNAAINPGNSGGALVNEYGQVIGITSSKLVDVDYEGIGFAIPIHTAVPIIEELIDHGYVSGRAKLGITGWTVDSVTAKYYNVPVGVQIVSIDENGSFAGSKAQVGDIIIGFDGHEITGMEDLQSLLTESSPGDVVEIELYRYSVTGGSGITLKVTVTLVENKG